jgi:aminopeptidase N
VASAHNLTRVAAGQRAKLLTVASYDVSLDLTDGSGGPGEGTFRGTTTVRFGCNQPGSNTMIEIAAVKLIEARLNGAPVNDWTDSGGLQLPGLAAQNELTVTAEFAYVSGGRGMHRSVDPADGEIYLYTSFEPAAAQCVFACFDQPDLKAQFTFHVRVPGAWRAISNMPETGREPDATGAVTVHFAPSPRMSTYISTVCAGPYAEVRSTEGGRDLGVFCRPSLLQHLDAEEIFDVTRRGMDFYEERFAQPYPLPKYDHVAVPEYLGAMENFGCIVFGEHLLIFRSAPTDTDRLQRAMVILHELAHMWFGDLVTMWWWDDLWLNEAFATWAAFWSLAEATTFPEPWAGFVILIKNGGIKADQLSSTHPVCADMPDVDATEVNFDAITYRKGASVLKQLAAYVGIDAFVNGLRRYFADHAWGNARFGDLVDALAFASGRPVREVAIQWLETAGVNTLRTELAVDADGRYQSAAVVQEAAAGYPTLRTHRIGVGLYDLAGSQLVRRERVEVEISGARTEIAELVGVRAPDVLLLNDDDLTYAKVRLDSSSLASVGRHIAGFDSTLARATCWAATIDMVNDAEMAAQDYVWLVHTGLPTEQSTTVMTSVLDDAMFAMSYLADPSRAAQGWAKLCQTCRSACDAAPPGSSLQLAWARAFAATARERGDLDRLHAWLSGAGLPGGLRLDADLRWLVLQALVSAGAAGSDEIEREAAADLSISGQREAATARALIPTVEAKQRAWQLALTDPDLSLDTRMAILQGYGRAAHVALTPDHVTNFLASIDEVWSRHGSEVGRVLAGAGFPKAHVSEQTLAAVDAWKAAGHHPPTMLKLVGDGRDGVARALAARVRDAEVTPPPW